MPSKCGLESDIFALGLLAYELMSNDRQPLLRGAPRGYSASLLRASAVPGDLHAVLQRSLSANPSERLTIAAFINSELFMDVNLRAVRFLEQLNEKDEAQRLTFLRGLPKLLQDPQSSLCSQRVLRERVLPRLCGALLFPGLYGVVVPIIVTILKREKVSDCAHYQARIWPSFKPLFTAKEIPIEVVILFLKELDLLVGLTAPADTQAVLLPFLLRCLELQEPVILNEVLEKVPFLHKKFEYRQVKDQILPRMLQLLLSASAVKVKVQVLMGLSRIFEIFDKTTITDVILTAFEKLTKTDRTPAVCMCLLGCYDAMSKHLGHKTTSERIIPLIAPLLVEEALSAEQWETQMSVCKKLLQRVEAARRKEYEVRKGAEAEAGQALGGAESPAEAGPAAAREAEPQDFESLLFAGTAKAVPPAPRAAPPGAAPKAAPQDFNSLLFPGAPQAAAPQPPQAAAPQLLQAAPPGAAPKAPSAMGNFDPFSTSTTANTAFGPGAFDPFASMAPAPAPAPAPALGLGCPGLALGAPGAPPLGFGAPAPGAGPPAGPAGLGAAGLDPGLMRNVNYDPFAEIDQRGR